MKRSATQKNPKTPVAAAQLRKYQKDQRLKAGGRKSSADTQRLLSELQVHQIEKDRLVRQKRARSR